MTRHRTVWTLPLAIVTTGLLLAGPAAAQTPGTPGSPGTTPGSPGTTTPTIPGPTTPGVPPGSPTPGAGGLTPGLPNPATPAPPPSVNDPTRNPSGTFPCPPGQARRPGSTICAPSIPTPR
jgi:hypothetical protein